jgi:hypothetical protein
MNNITSHQPTLACDLTAIPVEQKDGYQTAIQVLQTSIQERQELANGYAFRFPVEPQLSARLLDFIAAERRCCSFLTFILEFKPEGGPLWLQITGPEGTKQFLADNFN